MASYTKLRVAVAGASGETGQSIVKGLLAEPAQFDVVALARPESSGKAVYEDLAQAGATIEAADFLDIDALVERLAGADVAINCLLPLQQVESENLIDAAHRAGVGRFLPSFFAMIMPPRGVMDVRGLREDQLDRCKRLYLPYTVVDVGLWYQVALPPPYAAPPPLTDNLIGDGETPTAMIDKADIGTFVARIIADPRTLNRSVFAYGEVVTQNSIRAEFEAATGRKLPSDSQPVADLEAYIAKQQSSLAADPTNGKIILDLAMSQYKYSRYVRGDNTPDRAQYLGYLDGKTLYQDVKCKPMRDFIHELVTGVRENRIYPSDRKFD